MTLIDFSRFMLPWEEYGFEDAKVMIKEWKIHLSIER